jgi:hypothetical protein
MTFTCRRCGARVARPERIKGLEPGFCLNCCYGEPRYAMRAKPDEVRAWPADAYDKID